MGLFLNEYLYYYYYAEQALFQIQKDPITRGEEILELNEALLKKLASVYSNDHPHAAIMAYEAYERRRGSTYMHYARPNSPSLAQADQATPEGSLKDSAGEEGYAGMTLDVITALQMGHELYTVLNVPNHGAIEGLEAEDIVEVSTRTSGDEIHPIHIGKIPDQPAHLMQTVKQYERLAVDAILNHSIRRAVQALMAHPRFFRSPEPPGWLMNISKLTLPMLEIGSNDDV